jgi:hypothetical protein
MLEPDRYFGFIYQHTGQSGTHPPQKTHKSQSNPEPFERSSPSLKDSLA